MTSTSAPASPATPTTVRRADYQAPAWFVRHVELAFDLDAPRTIVTARLAVERNPAAPAGTPLRLDGEALDLLDIAIADQPLASDRYRIEQQADAQTLVVETDADRFVLTTRVANRPADNLQLSGLYATGQMLLTQCEAEGFRRITFFPDRPDVMATWRVTLRANRSRYPVLLSNGNLLSEGPVAGDDERHQAVWDDPFPKPSYLFALVAGQLQANEETYRTRSGRDVLLQVWADPANRDRTDYAMQSLKRSIAWDEQRFDLELDLDRFMIVATHDFNMGAMENKGLNIFNAKYLFADPQVSTDDDFFSIESIVAHEYFHNWTGNRVTCRDWFQLTLKEGLTVFRDQEFSADMLAAESGEGSPAAASARAVHRIETVRRLRAMQFAEDAGPMAHPIRPDTYQAIDNFYTATVYEKGAEVIRMLQTLVGVDGFRKGMTLYFERHDGQAVTCDDFVAAIADANGRDLSSFLRWYRTAGTPRIFAENHFDAGTGQYRLTLRQQLPGRDGQLQTPTAEQALPIPVAIALLDRDGSERLATTVELTAPEQSFAFDLPPHAPGQPPVLSLLRGFSAPVIASVAHSDDDLAFLLAHDTDPFKRGEAGPSLWLRAIESALNAASAPSALSALIDALGRALTDAHLDDGLRRQLLAIPSEGYLVEQLDSIDPARLRAARNAVRDQAARALSGPLKVVMAGEHWRQPYKLGVGVVARRGLANTALQLTTAIGDDESRAAAWAQFDGANNMTDRVAALGALLQTSADDADRALAAFERDFSHEPGVMDKWFMMQASMQRFPGGEPVLERIRRLQRHPAFSLKNPNKVRALLNVFCTANLAEFHRADGAGYALWVEQVLALDRTNPQVAARLARALDRHDRFVPALRDAMRAALAEVAAAAQSPNVKEIVDRARQTG